MGKSILSFILKLLGLSIVLFAIHYYILIQFFEVKLLLPLWLIYTFNATLVFIIFSAWLKFPFLYLGL